MNYRFFSIPAQYPVGAEVELNAFLAAHRVVRVESRFVENGDSSFWALAVEWLEGPTSLSKPGRSESDKGVRVDYREALSEADFALYARLRNLRKSLAESTGVPPYAVFTNEQLAAMVTRKVDSLAALSAIDGVGPSRVEKHGAAMLQELSDAVKASP